MLIFLSIALKYYLFLITPKFENWGECLTCSTLVPALKVTDISKTVHTGVWQAVWWVLGAQDSECAVPHNQTAVEKE